MVELFGENEILKGTSGIMMRKESDAKPFKEKDVKEDIIVQLLLWKTNKLKRV